MNWSALFLEAKSIAADKQPRCLQACLSFHPGRSWPLHSDAFCFGRGSTNSSTRQRCSRIKLLQLTPSLYQQTPLSGGVGARDARRGPSKRVHCQQVSRVLNACWPDRSDHGWSLGALTQAPFLFVSSRANFVAAKWSTIKDISVCLHSLNDPLTLVRPWQEGSHCKNSRWPVFCWGFLLFYHI